MSGAAGGRLPRAALYGAAVAAGLAVLVATPLLTGDYGAEVGFRFLLYVTLAEAWNLLAGYGGLVSLGSSSFIGVGAYVLVGLLNHSGAGIPLALIACGLCGAVLAAVVAPAVFRLRGLYFTVGTLALGEALRLFMVNVPFFGGATGIFLTPDPPSLQALYAYAAVLFLLTTGILSATTATRFSILLRAVRDDEDAAAQIGVRVFWVKLIAFMLASFLMGVCGGLQALKLGAIEPYGAFGIEWSIDIVSIVVIGGLGLRLGPLVGAVFVIALGELLANDPEIHLAITGLILVVVIRFAPKGLCGLAAQLAGTPWRARPPAAVRPA